MVFETVDECVEGTLRSSHERSGVCFGGFRLPARSRFGEGRPYETCGGTTVFSMWWLHSSDSYGAPKGLIPYAYTKPDQTFNYF
jgi:hypothetical protein